MRALGFNLSARTGWRVRKSNAKEYGIIYYYLSTRLDLEDYKVPDLGRSFYYCDFSHS